MKNFKKYKLDASSWIFLLFVLALQSCGDQGPVSVAARRNVVEIPPLVASGCLVKEATNFNEYAVVEDGSCLFEGCKDQLYNEYKKDVVVAHEVYKGMYPDSKFQSTCEYLLNACQNPNALNFVKKSINENGSCEFSGCLSDNYVEFDIEKDKIVKDYLQDLKDKNISFIGKINEMASCQTSVIGCTNSLATNYKSHLKKENGSCVFEGCFDENYVEYEKSKYQKVNDYLEKLKKMNIPFKGRVVKNKTCHNSVIGCTHSLAKNYKAQYTKENGSCNFEGCFDDNYYEYDKSAHDQVNDYLQYLKKHNITFSGNIKKDYLCQKTVVGCTHPLAKNYNSQFTKENGTCVFEGCYDDNFVEFDKNASDQVNEYLADLKKRKIPFKGSVKKDFQCKETVVGCTHSLAKNYKKQYSKENGSCQFEGCYDDNFVEFDKNASDQVNEYLADLKKRNIAFKGSVKKDFQCKETVIGCTNSLAFNYKQQYTKEDGSCNFRGCFVDTYAEYEKNKLQKIQDYIDDLKTKNIPYKGTVQKNYQCKESIVGCTQRFATNYRKQYIVEDGGCIFQGCYNDDYLEYNESRYYSIQKYFDELKKEKIPYTGSIDKNFECKTSVIGCTSAEASNYKDYYKKEDGKCDFKGCFDNDYAEYERDKYVEVLKYFASLQKANISYQGKLEGRYNCQTKISGCTEKIAKNYNPNFTKEDGTCEFQGCYNNKYLEYNKDQDTKISTYLNKLSASNISFKGTIDREKGCVRKLDGCTHMQADNYKDYHTRENGSCVFSGCIDRNYKEFDNILRSIVVGYQKANSLKSPPIVSTCVNKFVCNNKEATNYAPGKGYEYCEFTACDIPEYSGYKNYLNYNDYIKKYDGKVTVDNDSKYCGHKIMDIALKRSVDYVDVNFIIDTSGSMEDEIMSIKGAMGDITQLFNSSNVPVNINFFVLADVNKNFKNLKSPEGYPMTYYYPPNPNDSVTINSTTDLNQVQLKVDQILDDILTKKGSGYEQGLCFLSRLTQKYLESTEHKADVTLLITDEDNSGRYPYDNCLLSESKIQSDLNTYYTDSNGRGIFKTAVADMILAAGPAKAENYALGIIMYDKDNSSCVTKQDNTHGRDYLLFLDWLTHKNINVMKGDICAESYYDLLKGTLFSKYSEMVGLKYKLADDGKNYSLMTVQLIDNKQALTLIDPSLYELVEDSRGLFIEFVPAVQPLFEKNVGLVIHYDN
ncbi:MAG: hypothetical protein H6621_02275 [Halobacteriovoraceae bacterium]|nr:hypothetical protein [Halobacteriovoraceae bacterium]MCB9093870.1 hypothetical protein [Halobacteriovoraceae bacterium]